MSGRKWNIRRRGKLGCLFPKHSPNELSLAGCVPSLELMALSKNYSEMVNLVVNLTHLVRENLN